MGEGPDDIEDSFTVHLALRYCHENEWKLSQIVKRGLYFMVQLKKIFLRD